VNRLARLIRVARGQEPADLVFSGGSLVNVFSGRIEQGDLAVAGDFIAGIGRYEGRETIDVSGRFLAPGYIDPHLHLESTLLCPARITEVLLARGTTAVVADPHEIANVLGVEGIRLLIDMSRGQPLDYFFMVPSCVPSTHLETAGAVLDARKILPLLENPRVLGLAEMMNFPGLLAGVPEVLAKIEAFSQRPIDGHAPLLSGRDLCAYAAAGIGTEHECTRVDEAEEKLARGLRIFIREGSQARNLADLLPLVREKTLRRISFCTDDRHPGDLMHEGHLDYVLTRAVSLGLDPVSALTMATLNPAEAYGLKHQGALAPGYQADVVVLSDLGGFTPEKVYKNGQLVAENGELLVDVPFHEIPEWASPMNIGELNVDRLRIPVASSRVRVISLVENQILTEHLVEDSPERDGFLASDPDRDLGRLMVFERHQGSGRIGQGLVKGFGLKTGALASSIAHDSHNIVATGVDPEDILCAVEAVKEMGGGLTVAAGGRLLARLALPLAGLMTTAGLTDTATAERNLNKAALELGCCIGNPFMALSFLALPVIPDLKLTDKGLVDVNRFDFVPLFV
jgi:adenine deaminase